jgi:hypothetical protein
VRKQVKSSVEVRIVYVWTGEQLEWDVRYRDLDGTPMHLVGLGDTPLSELHTLFGAPGMGEASALLESFILALMDGSALPFP